MAGAFLRSCEEGAHRVATSRCARRRGLPAIDFACPSPAVQHELRADPERDHARSAARSSPGSRGRCRALDRAPPARASCPGRSGSCRRRRAPRRSSPAGRRRTVLKVPNRIRSSPTKLPEPGIASVASDMIKNSAASTGALNAMPPELGERLAPRAASAGQRVARRARRHGVQGAGARRAVLDRVARHARDAGLRAISSGRS